jgi:hypothetical protein
MFITLRSSDGTLSTGCSKHITLVVPRPHGFTCNGVWIQVFLKLFYGSEVDS